tara:strand:- start:232 stop:522 length:291 start_codon:yes stop_codon:yes gene_type:complete
MIGIRLGVAWKSSHTLAVPPPMVYSFAIVNCTGPAGTVYSASPSLVPGVRIFFLPELINPATSATLGEPFNIGVADPGYGSDGEGYVYNSESTCGG